MKRIPWNIAIAAIGILAFTAGAQARPNGRHVTKANIEKTIERSPAAGATATPLADPRGSCFYTLNGKRQWCVGLPDRYGAWDPFACAVVGRGTGRQSSWFFISEGHTDLGYARPLRRGEWNVSLPGGRALLGSVVQRSPKRFDIYKRGRLIGYTTPPHPAVVGLFRLAADACV